MSLPYYKRFPRDFLEGTIGLSFEVKGAYAIVLDLIYMRDGRLPDDARFIAGQLGCSVRKWTAIREELIARGKLQVHEGIISNFRADYLTEESRSYQDKQREIARAPRKNNDLRQPEASQSEPEPDKKDREAIASLVQNLAIAISAGVEAMKAAKAEAAKAFDGRFRAFWAAYPRRVKKPDALKAYAKAEARIGEDALRVILDGIERALPGWDNPKFIPHPATWLNACQWEDEAPANIIPLRIGNDQSSPDRKYAAKQSNYDAALTGSEWASQLVADRRTF